MEEQFHCQVRPAPSWQIKKIWSSFQVFLFGPRVQSSSEQLPNVRSSLSWKNKNREQRNRKTLGFTRRCKRLAVLRNRKSRISQKTSKREIILKQMETRWICTKLMGREKYGERQKHAHHPSNMVKATLGQELVGPPVEQGHYCDGWSRQQDELWCDKCCETDQAELHSVSG